jgi:hypothetical protein
MPSIKYLLLFLFPICFSQGSPDIDDSASSVLSTPGGRFVFGQVSSFRKDQYMLDTSTGRLWVITVSKEGVLRLEPVSYVYAETGLSFSAPSEADEINALIADSKEKKKNQPTSK